MSRILALTVIVTGLALGSSPVSAAATRTSHAADVAAIRSVGQTWKDHYAAGRYALIPALYTQDTMVMPRNRPRIEGRPAMARSIGGLAAGRKVDIDMTEREIGVAGDFGWFIGDFRVTYTPQTANAQPKVEYGRSLILFRRDADKQWRVHRDIDSPAPEPVATALAAIAPAQGGTTGAAFATAPRWSGSDRTIPTDCDRLASSRYDRTRLAKPRPRDEIDVPAAIRTCEADLARLPGDPRLHFHLGRLYGYAGDVAKTLMHRRAASAAGNHNTIFLLGYLAWSTAKTEAARCAAHREMRDGADRGNYSAQLTYASLFLEGKFAPCPDTASPGDVADYVKAARPVVDGFFETRLADHLTAQLEGRSPVTTSR